MSETYYQVLGIPRDADQREIKRAYHRLARELHPDKADSSEKARDVEQRFAVVSTAYNVLKDQGQRTKYDQTTFGSKDGGGQSGAPKTATAAVMSAPRNVPKAKSGQKKKGGSARASAGLTAGRAAIAQKAYVKGLQLIKAKNFAKAAEFFEAAIKNNDQEANYHARLGDSLIQAKKSASKAIDAAQRAIELDQYNLDFKFNLAQIYEAIGSKSNAIKLYHEILKWDAENKMAQQLLRGATVKKGLFGKGGGGLFSSFLRKK